MFVWWAVHAAFFKRLAKVALARVFDYVVARIAKSQAFTGPKYSSYIEILKQTRQTILTAINKKFKLSDIKLPIASLSELTVINKIVCVILRLAGWVKIKYLHLIRWEGISPGKDCVPVLYCRWNRVQIVQTCSWEAATVGIILNDDIMAKDWTSRWTPVNCLSCVSFLHLTDKRCQAFIIVERKNKRFGSSAPVTTGFWETKST